MAVKPVHVGMSEGWMRGISFWCRLFGCYEALSGGELSEALADFTGGVSETRDLQTEPFLTDEDQREQFYDWLVRTINNNGVMCAAINVSDALLFTLWKWKFAMSSVKIILLLQTKMETLDV